MMKIKYHNIMTVWQVRFMNMSVVSAVQTQGRPGFSWAQWVSTYRLEYSQDCVNFNSVLNVDGSNQVGTWMFCDLLSHQIIKNLANLSNVAQFIDAPNTKVCSNFNIDLCWSMATVYLFLKAASRAKMSIRFFRHFYLLNKMYI